MGTCHPRLFVATGTPPLGAQARNRIGERVPALAIVVKLVPRRARRGKHNRVAGPRQGNRLVDNREHPVLMPVNLDEGDRRGGCAQGCNQRSALGANHDHAAQKRLDLANEVGEVLTLGVSAHDPDRATRGETGEGRAGGVGVGGLGVIHPRQIRDLTEDRAAVPRGSKCAQAILDRLGLHPVRSRQRGRGERVEECRSRGVRPIGALQVRDVREGE